MGEKVISSSPWTYVIGEYEAGSTAHGISIDGTDDKDYFGIFVGSPKATIGFNVTETKEVRTQPKDVPSKPGDTDRVLHSLRKFCLLGLKGNPSVMNYFFAPEYLFTILTDSGKRLREPEIVNHFSSLSVVKSFLGYLKNQRERMDGSRGRKGKVRVDLIQKHGYDTKYAGHAIRLGVQGICFAEEGGIPIPIPSPWRETIIDVRLGKHNEKEALEMIDSLSYGLEQSLKKNPLGLPKRSDSFAIESMMVDMYADHWQSVMWPAN